MMEAILLIIITLLLPPLGVFLVAGCTADVFINILLTILGYFPGHIHAFYVLYIYYLRRDQARNGYVAEDAPFIFSERVQRGGKHASGFVPPEYVPENRAVVASEPVYEDQPAGQPGSGAIPPPKAP